jgi:hypothetical protein
VSRRLENGLSRPLIRVGDSLEFRERSSFRDDRVRPCGVVRGLPSVGVGAGGFRSRTKGVRVTSCWRDTATGEGASARQRRGRVPIPSLLSRCAIVKGWGGPNRAGKTVLAGFDADAFRWVSDPRRWAEALAAGWSGHTLLLLAEQDRVECGETRGRLVKQLEQVLPVFGGESDQRVALLEGPFEPYGERMIAEHVGEQLHVVAKHRLASKHHVRDETPFGS